MLNGLPTVASLLEASCSKNNTKCENPSFEKIRTISVNWIQLHYFDDVINELNLIDLEMNES